MKSSGSITILSIETSCDETAMSVLRVNSTNTKSERFTLLGNALLSQIELHRQYGGVFPMMAKREHVKNSIPILIAALTEAKLLKKKKVVTPLAKKELQKIEKILVREKDILEPLVEFLTTYERPLVDAIAVTRGPGLEPALWVGINVAQVLGAVWGITVIPVNHMEGHILSIIPQGKKTFSIPHITFPILSLLVSGGHTELVVVKKFGTYEKIGETRDDAVGEAFDKVARIVGLPYPGGPEIARLASTHREKSTDNIVFPRPMMQTPDFDFSFSGLKTAVLYHTQKLVKLTPTHKQAIARGFEDAAIEVLVAKTLRALETYHAQGLIVGGGVACNTYLQSELTRKITEKYGKKFPLYFPARGLATDNAVMIALAGYMTWKTMKNKKPASSKKMQVDGNWSL